MPLVLNKDREAWDPETGFVYNEDGTVLRAGHRHFSPMTTAAAKRAAAALLGGEA